MTQKHNAPGFLTDLNQDNLNTWNTVFKTWLQETRAHYNPDGNVMMPSKWFLPENTPWANNKNLLLIRQRPSDKKVNKAKAKISTLLATKASSTDAPAPEVPQWIDVLDYPNNTFITAEITWIAFPKTLKTNYGAKAYEYSDMTNPAQLEFFQKRYPDYINNGATPYRLQQDEYCEYSVTRNDQGKITKITLTCEGPEYWNFLAKNQPDKLLQLYQQYVSKEVKLDDLIVNGSYVPANKWNAGTQGGTIMHLNCPPNSLTAEVTLGSQATIVRKDKNGNIITDSQQLINCSLYGLRTRNSDPTIGAGVNALARDGYLISLKDPIALYIASFNPVGAITPPLGNDDDDVTSFFTIIRGSKDYILRAEFAVPDGKGYVVGDLLVNGAEFKYGSQLLDFVSMKLTGVATDKNPSRVQPQNCLAD